MATRRVILSRLLVGVSFSLTLLGAEAPQGYCRFPTLHGQTVVFTAEGDLWRAPAGGGTAHRWTSHPGQETHAAISPDGATIAYSAQYEGPTEVYTMPLEGGRPTRQTFAGAGAVVVGWTPGGRILYATEGFSTLPNMQLVSLDPRTGRGDVLPLAQASEGVFSDDGKTLFFTRLAFQGSQTKRYQGGTAQNLWRYTLGEAEATPLAPEFKGTSKNPMWWQQRVYFLSDRDGIMNLWSMNPAGADLKQLTHHRDYDLQSASLDAGRIVYQQGADLWLYDLATAQDHRLHLTLASDFDQERERWVKQPLDYLTAVHLSPDGDRVVLTARGQVFVAPAEQGRLVEVPRRQGVRYRQAGFWPDGKSLFALSDETGELEFWKLPANGVGPSRPLTHGGTVFRFAGVASPDGHWLAWSDKNQELWVFNPGRNAPQRVARSTTDGFADLAWSPDSQWLAYVATATNTYRQIHLYRPADGKETVLTGERVSSFSPAWSPDGKWLYFLSDRTLRSLVPSPWGPRQPEPFFTEATRIYLLALTPGLRSPFRPKDELAPAEAEAEAKTESNPAPPEASTKRAAPEPPAAKSGAGKSAAKPGAEAEKGGGVKVSIDFAGLQDRLEVVPVPAGNYSELAVTPKYLLWTTRDTAFAAKLQLKQMEITAHDPKPKTFVEDLRSYELAQDRKKLLVRKGDHFYVLAADSAAPAKLEEKEVKLDGWAFALDPREEWRQIYVEAWRMMRDFFYDRNLNGVDWPAVRQKYLPLVARVSDRAELNDVIAQMVGELSALHTFVRFGDEREGPDHITPAALGAQFTREGAGWRVSHIYRGDPDYPDALSPLARPEVGVREGDLITSINGVATAGVRDPAALLRGQAGKQVLLEIAAANDKPSRPTIVEPITPGQAADLRYDEWEYTRRQTVEKLSTNQIGYVHLRAMGAGNIAEWARGFYPVFQRPGLIIDVRHNRGGNIDSWILEKLLRKAWFFWQPRVGDPTWNMQYAFRGHLVVLCDEHTASDGEAFTEGFRRLGLGTVIGTRTWGGEIWLSAQRWLVDSGMATAAETGVYGPERAWLIEGHGVDPDLRVDNPPHATFLGTDTQLEAAVRYLQARIAKDPRPIPPPPQYPNKRFAP